MKARIWLDCVCVHACVCRVCLHKRKSISVSPLFSSPLAVQPSCLLPSPSSACKSQVSLLLSAAFLDVSNTTALYCWPFDGFMPNTSFSLIHHSSCPLSPRPCSDSLDDCSTWSMFFYPRLTLGDSSVLADKLQRPLSLIHKSCYAQALWTFPFWGAPLFSSQPPFLYPLLSTLP